MISFAGVAQILPAMMGGIFWRGATRTGALFGLIVGFTIWAYTLFLPSFGGASLLPDHIMTSGPFGISWLRPQGLFGTYGLDPVVHAVFWSIFLNSSAFFIVSVLTFPAPMERLQGAQFVNIYDHSKGAQGWTRSMAETEDLLVMAQRILGPKQAQTLFRTVAQEQGKAGYLPDPEPMFLERLERELTGSVGAATAHAMVEQIVGGASVSVKDLMAVADETAQIMEYSSQLEAKSEEVARAARQLREANEKLTELSVQKDGFLSQISHELRTPMTSIRAFSEILRENDGMTDAERRRYSGIIHDETLRLTRLLDDLLDLSVLENGQVDLSMANVSIDGMLDRALLAAKPQETRDTLRIQRVSARPNVIVHTDADRLTQVFINLISNVYKYCGAARPELTIRISDLGDEIAIDFVDNGSGIRVRDQAVLFEKFSRLGDEKAAGGAGLGLAICREIMGRLGGAIAYLPGQGGAAFRVTIPVHADEHLITPDLKHS